MSEQVSSCLMQAIIDAKKSEDEHQYRIAIEKYEKIRLDVNFQNSFIIFECIFSTSRNLLCLTSIENQDGYGINQIESIIKDMKINIYRSAIKMIELKKNNIIKNENIKNEDEKKIEKEIKFKIRNYLIPLYQKFESYLDSNGFNEEANEIYKEYRKLYIAQTKYIRENKKIISRFFVFIREKFDNFAIWLLNFGWNTTKISVTTLVLIFLFGSFFWYFHGIGSTIGKIDSDIKWFHYYYYSIATIFSLGTEEFYPITKIGIFLFCLEAISGFVIISFLIAHLLKKIR